MEAVAELRDSRSRAASAEDLFTRFEKFIAPEMRFTADLIVNRNVEDEFGVKAQAAISTLRYEVAFRMGPKNSGMLELASESLEPISQQTARGSIGFKHSRAFRNSVISGRRTVDFISSSKVAPTTITVHQEGHGGRKIPAPNSTRTVLGGMANADFPSILSAHQEMRSWQTLMLEPSAMRSPSLYRDPGFIDSRGANLPNTIYRLMRQEDPSGRVASELANRLARLIDDVTSARVIEDERFETRTLTIAGRDGVEHAAHSLSDGTLRFLVLTVLDLDPEMEGVICLEEPENGIHPERIETIIRLLQDIAVDADLAVDSTNPLRQVIVNTHSPKVVSQVTTDDLIYIERERIRRENSQGYIASAYVPPRSWREGGANHLVTGQMTAYLGRGGPPDQNEQLLIDWYNAEIDKT